MMDISLAASRVGNIQKSNLLLDPTYVLNNYSEK